MLNIYKSAPGQQNIGDTCLNKTTKKHAEHIEAHLAGSLAALHDNSATVDVEEKTKQNKKGHRKRTWPAALPPCMRTAPRLMMIRRQQYLPGAPGSTVVTKVRDDSASALYVSFERFASDGATTSQPAQCYRCITQIPDLRFDSAVVSVCGSSENISATAASRRFRICDCGSSWRYPQ